MNAMRNIAGCLRCNLLDMEAEGDLLFLEMKTAMASFKFFWKGGIDDRRIRSCAECVDC
jgi:hypothetical protein